MARHEGRLGLLCSTALLTVLALPAVAQPAANARPTGGQVVAGSAAISQASPTATVITQSTNRAAIDWQSFSVGSQQSVDFRQPSSSAMTLNRVTGPDPSAIAGRIQANGGVVLTNPNGVVFYKGSQVNAQDVIVSTAGITNQNFMAGKLVFDQAGRPDAKIVNAGTITVKDTGLAALVAPQVANSGVISARLGHAVLAGAAAATLDLYGDGLLSVDVTRQVTQAPKGKTALVTNTGTVVADGGQVLLTAQAADGVVQNLVAAGGKIAADSVGTRIGSIAIEGTGGSIVISGQLSAMGLASGSTGGSIEMVADKAVTLTPRARVNASGAAGGGTIAVGSSLTRSGVAAATSIAAGAKLVADASRSGNGGKVVVLSTQSTAMHGRIEARGGPTAGNGGTVEVSTGGVLTLDGSVDLTAPHGRLGAILIDPGTLDITASPPGGTLTAGGVYPQVSFTQGGTVGVSYITPAEIAALSGSIELQASADINVQSAVRLTATYQPLSLVAGGNLTVSAPITTTAPITLIAGSGQSPTPTLSGSISIQAAISGQEISLSSGTGGVVLNANLTTTTRGVYFGTTGPVTQTGGVITTGDLGGTAASLSLPGANRIGYVTGFTASSGGFNLAEAPGQALSVFGAITVPNRQGITLTADALTLATDGYGLNAPNGDVTLRPATAGLPIALTGYGAAVPGALSLSQYTLQQVNGAKTLTIGATNSGPISIASGGGENPVTFGNTLVLNSGSVITQTGTLDVGALGGSALGVTLANPGNVVPTVSGFTASGSPTSSFTLANSGSISVTGPLSATSTIQLTSGAGVSTDINLQSSLNAATVSLNASGLLTQTAGTIGATLLSAFGRNGLSLPQPNQVATLGNVGGTSVSFNNAAPLVVAGTVGSGSSSATTISAPGGISLASGATVAGAGMVAFETAGPLAEDPAAQITTTVLVGTAGTAALGGTANAIRVVENFAVSAGNFTLVDASPLIVAGTVSVPTGRQIALQTDNISFVTGATAGGNGLLSAPGGGVTLAPLTSGRSIEVIASGTANPAALSLTTVELGDIGTGTLTLGSATAGNINLGNIVASGTVDQINLNTIAATLNLVTASSGTVTQGGTTGYAALAGGLSVGTLTGSVGRLVLQGDNSIAGLGSLTVAGGALLRDNIGLTVTGPVSAGDQIVLADSNGTLLLAGSVTAPSVFLYAQGGFPIVQTGGGVTADALTAIGSGVTLGSTTNNLILTNLLRSYSSDIILVNGAPLTVSGSGAFAAGNIALTAGTGDLVIDAPLRTAAGGTLTLNAPGGTISDTANAYVAAGTLTGGGAALSLFDAITIASVGDFLTQGGFSLANGGVIAVAGTVTDPTSILVSSIGDMTLSGVITAPLVTLETDVSGGIRQTGGAVNGSSGVSLSAGRGGIEQSGGMVTGGTLTLQASSGSVDLPGSANSFAALGASQAGYGFAVADARGLAVAGLLYNDTGKLTLTVGGSLSVGAKIASPAGITLTATGAITEPLPGILNAATLSVSGASVALGNTVNNVATLSGGGASSGSFALADFEPLTVTGRVAAGAGATLALASDRLLLTPAATLSAPGGVIALGPGNPTDGFTLVNPGSVSAGVTAAVVAIGSTIAGNLTLDGVFDFSAAGSVFLGSGSGISESSATVLTVATLVGDSLGPVLLNATNSIAAIGSFSSVGGFSVTVATPLAVVGSLTDSAAISLNVSGGDLTLAGVITAPTVAFYALGGAITQSGGGIVAGTLTASAATGIGFGGPGNRIGSTALLEALGDVSLVDQIGVTLGGSGVIAGSFSGSAAGGIAITSLIEAPNSVVSLQASGAVTESGGGGIEALVLTGSAASAALGGTNVVGTLGAFTSTGGFVLADTEALSIAGPVADGAAIAIASQGGIYLSGNVTAPQVSLAATTGGREERLGGPTQRYGNGYGGNISQTGGGIVASTAVTLSAAGAVSQTGGSIVTPLLAVYAGSYVSLPSTTNRVASLGSVSSVGGFTLQTGVGLTLAGPVGDTALVSLSTAGSLAIAGSLTAPSVILQASGAISEPGGVIAATTLGGSGGGVSLAAANAVGTLGGFVSSGSFLLTDSQPLTVAGTVAVAGGATLALFDNAPGFAVGALLSAPAGVVVLAPATSGAAIALVGIGGSLVNAATLVVGAPDAGPITLAGTLAFPGVTVLDLLSGGAVSQASGGLVVGTLEGSAASVSLAGGNTIGAIGGFASSGGFVLADGGPLTLVGSLSAASVSLGAPGQSIGETTGSIATGTLSASGGSVVLGGVNTIATAGSLVATGGALTLVDSSGLTLVGGASAAGGLSLTTGGGLALGGTVSGATVTLNAAGAVSQVGGSAVVAGSLAGDATSIVLTGGANSIAGLGGITVAGGVALVDQASLTVGGPVIVGTTLSLRSAGSLGLAGNLTAPSVVLGAGLGIVQSGGTVTAGTLSGSAGGAVALGDANAVGTLGVFSSVGGFRLADGQSLAVVGPVSDTAGIALSVAGNLGLGGSLSAPDLEFVATGGIVQSGGVLTTQTLGGSGASVALGQVNAVGTLGGFVSGGNFLLTDGQALTISGTNAVAAGATLALNDDSPGFAAGALLSAPSGTVVLAPATAGDATSLGSAGIGHVAAGTLVIGAATAGAIAIDGSFDFSATPVLDLVSGGAVTESGSAGLNVPVLGVNAASAALGGSANTIGSLGSVSVSGGFGLVDQASLTVGGPVIVGTTLSLVSAGSLGLAGNLTAPSVVLGAGLEIVQSGGTVTAGTLSGSAGGAVALGDANAVGTLGVFSSVGGFRLADGQSLAVVGPVSDTAGIALSVAGNLGLGGSLSAPALELVATGGIVQSGGVLTAQTLGGSGASVALGQVNGVGTLGGFVSGGNFLLTDGQALTISGTNAVAAGATLALNDDSPGFAAGALLSAPSGMVVLAPATAGDAISLGSAGIGHVAAGTLVIGAPTAGAMSIGGSFDFSATPVLELVSGGAVTETALAGLNVPSLAVSAASAALGGAANTIASLGSVAVSGGFSLVDQASLTVSGPVVAGSLLLLDSVGSLTLAGSLAAPTLALAAGGGVLQSAGAVTAGVLSGSAGGAVTLGQVNAVGTLGGFVSGANFLLTDGRALTIAGSNAVASGATLSLNDDTPTFTAGALLSAPSGTVLLAPATAGDGIALGSAGIGHVTAGTLVIGAPTAGPISIGGSFDFSATPVLDLVSGAAVTESAAAGLTVPVLAVSAASAALAGSANTIAQLGGVAVAGGFSLVDQASLTVTGPVVAGSTLALASAGSLALAGSLSAPTLVLGTGGGIFQSAGAVAALVLSGTAGGAVSLGQANSIGTLGGFTGGGNLLLADSRPLTIAGTNAVAAGATLALDDDAPNFAAGALLSAPSGTVVLAPAAAGDAMAVGSATIGRVSGGTLVIGAPTAGAIALAGSFDLSGVAAVDLLSASSISESGGITANQLSAQAGQIALAGAGNAIASLGTVIAGGGSLLLADNGPLTLAGPVVAGAVTLEIGGPVTEAGTAVLAVGTLGGRAGAFTLTGSANTVALLGAITSGSGFALIDQSDLGVAGPVTDGVSIALQTTGQLSLMGSLGAPAVSLVVGGAISQSAGAVAANVLTGASGGAVALGDANTIGSIGSFTAIGSLAVTDTTALTVAGPLAAPSIGLTDSAPITLTGSLATGALTIVSGGTVLQSTGTIDVGFLTGSAVGLAQFGPDDPGPVAAIGTLGPFTVTGGNLDVASAIPMVVSGPLSAAAVALSAPGSITLSGGTIALTGAATSTISVTGSNGSLTQSGTTTVTSPGGAGLAFTVPSGGTVRFADLAAPNTRVGLNLGSGTVTGTIDVAGLEVIGGGGTAALFGTIGNNTGPTAALAVDFTGIGGTSYLLNNCQIAAVSCTATFVQPSGPTAIVQTAIVQTGGTLTFQLTDVLSLIPLLAPNLGFTGDIGGGDQQLTARGSSFRVPFLNGFVSFLFSRDIADPDLVLPNVAEGDY